MGANVVTEGDSDFRDSIARVYNRIEWRRFLNTD